MQILASGTAAGTGTITLGMNASVLMVKAVATAVIKIGLYSFRLDTTSKVYEEFRVDFNSFEIVSGTVDYVCLG